MMGIISRAVSDFKHVYAYFITNSMEIDIFEIWQVDNFWVIRQNVELYMNAKNNYIIYCVISKIAV